ncbi:MAG: universal stress protein [Planctomycetales bacterium]
MNRHVRQDLEEGTCEEGVFKQMTAYGYSVLQDAFWVRRILHPTDLSQGSEVAFAHALRLAVNVGACLQIIHIDREDQNTHWKTYPKVRETLQRWSVLFDVATEADLAKLNVGVEKVKAHATDPVLPILEALERDPVDLIVLATHQRKGLDRWLHKDIATRLARLASVKTLFVPHHADGFVNILDGTVLLHNVLIPVNDEPRPEAAIQAASALALALGGASTKFHLLHVGDFIMDLSSLTLPNCDDWSWKTSFGDGNVVQEILSSATRKRCDLIAMTTQGHHGFLDALRGSTTEKILREANCPVLAVPAA